MRSLSLAFLLCTAAAGAPQGSGPASPPPSRPLPDDLAQLERMAAWKKSEPKSWPPIPNPPVTCGIDDTVYRRVRLDYESPFAFDDAAATRDVADIDRRVVNHLAHYGWRALDLGPDDGIPTSKRCYSKHGVYVQVFQTTGRCTMNSPCNSYDGFAFVVYLPIHSPSASGGARR